MTSCLLDPYFCRILPVLFELEGGYVDDPNDPGGETNYGISKRSYPSLDIKNLTPEQAANIYFTDYWLAGNCNAIPVPLCYYHFDTCVNQGVKTANRILQQTVGVAQDGVIGPLTLAAAVKLPRTEYYLYLAFRLAHYMTLQNWGTYGKGWTNRMLRLCAALC